MMYVPVPHSTQGIFDAFIVLAKDDAPSHDLTHRCGCRVQTVGGCACGKILLGQDADEGVTLANGKAADIVVSHPACGVSERGAWRCPFDPSAHQLADNHGRPPAAWRS